MFCLAKWKISTKKVFETLAIVLREKRWFYTIHIYVYRHIICIPWRLTFGRATTMFRYIKIEFSPLILDWTCKFCIGSLYHQWSWLRSSKGERKSWSNIAKILGGVWIWCAPDIVQYGEIGTKAEIRALNSILWKFLVGWRRTKYMTKRDDTGLLRKTNGNRMAILKVKKIGWYKNRLQSTLLKAMEYLG